eukprot:scaffold11603_cov107-Isochrysis_galbana.AAC.1
MLPSACTCQSHAGARRRNRSNISGAACERKAWRGQQRLIMLRHDVRRLLRPSDRTWSPAGPTDCPISLPKAAPMDAST